jgi:outer membrane protein assembly factor BamE (lipoprotein component of BamABCDE complex)
MKTYLIVYTRNDSPSGFKIDNETVNAKSSAAARDQIIELLGDTIVIINIIELE